MMESTANWKRLWRALTHKALHVPPDVISTYLEVCKNYLLDGFTSFTPFTEDSFKLCAEKVNLTNYSVKFQQFIYNLGTLLDLDACETWAQMNSYLMYEYCGGLKDVENILNDYDAVRHLLSDIWKFYVIQQTYLVQILKYVLENHKDTSHVYHVEYAAFIESVTYKTIRQRLLKQLQHLISVVIGNPPPDPITATDLRKSNNSLILEVLLVILTSMEHQKFDSDEFLEMLNFFVQHRFGITCHSTLLTNIQHVEIAIFLVGLDRFWYQQHLWYNKKEEIEKLVEKVYLEGDIPTVLVAWATLQSTLPRELAEKLYAEHAHIYMKKSLELNVFNELHEIVSNPIFNDSIAGMLTKTAVFSLFDVVCHHFEQPVIYRHPSAILLMSSILSMPEYAYQFINQSAGLTEFYFTVISMFPFHFETVSLLFRSIVSLKECAAQAYNQLCALDKYTELYDSAMIRGIRVINNRVMHDYRPYNDDSVVFQSGAEFTLDETGNMSLITIKGVYNYFMVLRHTLETLIEYFNKKITPSEESVNDVVVGLQLLSELMEVEPELMWSNQEVKNLLHTSLCLLATSLKPPTKNMRIMKVCFELAIHMFKHDPAEIVRALLGIDFLPKINKTEPFVPENFSRTLLLSSCKLFTYIEEDLLQLHSCELLHVYVKFITEVMKMNIYHIKIQIPGLIYLITKMFPAFIREAFLDNTEKRKIQMGLLKFVHGILTSDPGEISDHNLLIYQSVMNLFAKSSGHVISLVHGFYCGNTNLDMYLMTEGNWKSGTRLDCVETVRMCLECILSVLNFIKKNHEDEYGVEQLLYASNQQAGSFLKVICGYTQHCFDSSISITAFQILKVFVDICHLPLLPSLQLDDTRLRKMFMERLNDALDDHGIKMCIINLVAASVGKQSSMTAAFFNVMTKVEVEDSSNIFTFLEAFLKITIEKTSVCLMPLHEAILLLFHELWKNFRQHLLQKLTDKESFWESFTIPLANKAVISVSPLLRIFEIIILDLLCSTNDAKEKFNKGLKHIFSNPKEFFDMWIERLLPITCGVFNESYLIEKPDPLAAITIWKNFVLTVRLVNREFFECEWNNGYFLVQCLKCLVFYMKNGTQPNVLIQWCELCIVFNNNETEVEHVEDTEIFICLTHIAQFLADNYTALYERGRTVILTLICIVTRKFPIFLQKYSDHDVFYTALEQIFFYEYCRFQSKSKDENYNNWIIMLRIIHTFTSHNPMKSEYEHFFIHIRYAERISEVLGICIYNNFRDPIARVTAKSLLEFAETYCHHFQFIDLSLIIKQLLPLRNCMLQENSIIDGIIPENLKEWWSVYLHIIQFFQMLLQKGKGVMYHYVVEFYLLHKSVWVDVLTSATILAHSTNLDVVLEILRLLHGIIQFKHFLMFHDYYLFLNIVACIKGIINAMVGIFLRPKCLLFVPKSPKTENEYIHIPVPTKTIILVLNKCLEILTWSCKCLNKISPPFNELLYPIDVTQFYGLIQHDLRVILSTDDAPHSLRYGSLICGLNCLCNTYSQINFPSSFGAPVTTTMDSPESIHLEHEDFNIIILPITMKVMPAELRALHGFTVPDVTGFEPPWIHHLNSELIYCALSSLATLLAGQVVLTTHDKRLDSLVQRQIQRELCSEFTVFYDFVLKYLLNKYPEEGTASTDTRVFASPRGKTKTSDTLTDTLSSSQSLIIVDILKICTDVSSGKRTTITNVDDSYLLLLVHWFRHVCRLVRYSKFDEFLFGPT